MVSLQAIRYRAGNMEASAIDNGYASDRAPSSSQPRGVSRAVSSFLHCPSKSSNTLALSPASIAKIQTVRRLPYKKGTPIYVSTRLLRDTHLRTGAMQPRAPLFTLCPGENQMHKSSKTDREEDAHPLDDAVVRRLV